MKFKALFPEFYVEVEQLLRKHDLPKVLEQLPHLEISGRCDCGDSFCSTFYVKPARELNIIQKNIIGAHHGETVDLAAQDGMVIIDLNNFGSVTTFEVLYRPDVEKSLGTVFRR